MSQIDLYTKRMGDKLIDFTFFSLNFCSVFSRIDFYSNERNYVFIQNELKLNS